MKISELPKEAKDKFLEVLRTEIELDLAKGTVDNIRKYASDTDEFVRKNTYIILGKYFSTQIQLRDKVYFAVDQLLRDTNSQIRQTAVLAFSEMMKFDPKKTIGLLGKIRPNDLLWLPREVLDLVRRTGQMIIGRKPE
jgi:hypothetical protein